MPQSNSPANPPHYPLNGTYADLLNWHLYIWGTRPSGKRALGDAWDPDVFLESVYGPNSTRDDPGRSLNYWLGNGSPPKTATHRRILRVLFRNDPIFDDWRADLNRARIDSSGTDGEGEHKNKKTVPVITRVRIVEQDTQFAAAARENVGLIVDRLTKGFYGRTADLAAINDFVKRRMEGGPNGLLVITAPPGFGKSALAAHWCANIETKTDRRIAKHFCCVSSGRSTTSTENIYAHLHLQIAEALNQPVHHQPGSFDSLVDLLRLASPAGNELIVWLDGIDEADGQVECFLPMELGAGICVIVSARADELTIPAFLEPWLADAMAVSHHPIRHSMKKFSPDDVEGLVVGLSRANSIATPEGLAKRIFYASDFGYPIFVRNMADTAIEAICGGYEIDFGNAPNTLLGYAESELRRLERLERWSELLPIFSLLTLSPEAVRIDELGGLVDRSIFPSAFPLPLLRWLTLVYDASSAEAPLLSFAHPLLAELFGQALGFRRQQALTVIYDSLARKSYGRWPEFALKHFPKLLLQVQCRALGEALLSDADFIQARHRLVKGDNGEPLEPYDFGKLMIEDWEYFRADYAPPVWGEDQIDKSEAGRHIRFWNFSKFIFHPMALSFRENWHQLIWAVNRLVNPNQAPAVDERGMKTANAPLSIFGYKSGKCSLLRVDENKDLLLWNWKCPLHLYDREGNERATLAGHRGIVYGALALGKGAGYLSWGADNTLRLWGAAGENGPVLDKHTNQIRGALALSNSAGFLSWSLDHTLRLWNVDGSERRVLRDADGYPEGALALADGSGFFSWHSDGALRFWSSTGIFRSALEDRMGAVDGALELHNRETFVFWGGDGIPLLTLWKPSTGWQKTIYNGYERPLNGAAALGAGEQFLTWSEDGTLQIWGLDGEEVAVLGGHTGPVIGVLALAGNASFISWSKKEILLGGLGGNQCEILRGHEGPIRGVLALSRGAGYLSWSEYEILLWNSVGELRNIWIGPHQSIEKVFPCVETHRYLVKLASNLCIIDLAPKT